MAKPRNETARGGGSRPQAGKKPVVIDPERRYAISEVSDYTGVPIYTLRHWEKLFWPLSPKRDRAGRRYYMKPDIDAINLIKQYLWVEKIQPEGALIRLIQDLRGVPAPKSRQEVLDLLDKMAGEVRAAIDLIDKARLNRPNF